MDEKIVMYTAKDIQRIFGCCNKQAYKIMKIKGFPSISIDNRIYVEESALRKWIEKNKGNHLFT